MIKITGDDFQDNTYSKRLIPIEFDEMQRNITTTSHDSYFNNQHCWFRISDRLYHLNRKSNQLNKHYWNHDEK